MQREVTHNRVAQLFALFGVDVMAMMRGASDPRATLVEAKAIARRSYKRKAVKAHPDHGGDEERFKELTAVHNEIQSLEFMPARHIPFVGISITIEADDDGWQSTLADPTTTTTSTIRGRRRR
jgi:hypothetical protein